jgi:hypothetical protein
MYTAKIIVDFLFCQKKVKRAGLKNESDDGSIAAMAAESVRQGGAERSEAQHLADLGANSATGAEQSDAAALQKKLFFRQGIGI